MIESKDRVRALRAARAVTLAGALQLSGQAGCGGGTEVHAPSSPAETEERELEGVAPAGTVRPVEGQADEPVAPIVIPDDARITPVDPAGSAAERAGESCSKELDGFCPEGCDRNTDADCCEADDEAGGTWCSFSPDWGCSCAIEGPFAPPGFR